MDVSIKIWWLVEAARHTTRGGDESACDVLAHRTFAHGFFNRARSAALLVALGLSYYLYRGYRRVSSGTMPSRLLTRNRCRRSREMSNQQITVFSPFKLGHCALPNRMVMAPMTRNRATDGNVPSELALEYYRQRTSAGLIITEATQVAQEGQGYPFTPGIHSPEQVAGWRRITDAVHAGGGRIFLQLWHVGRISHPSYQPGGAAPVAPSALKPAGQVYTLQGPQDFVTPRALDTAQIAGVVEQFRHGARNALEAGFDGVEIHGANGYLLDQFLRDGTNRRADAYGCSLENRARFMLEVVDAVCSVWNTNHKTNHQTPLNP